jgi:hypothetical protein
MLLLTDKMTNWKIEKSDKTGKTGKNYLLSFFNHSRFDWSDGDTGRVEDVQLDGRRPQVLGSLVPRLKINSFKLSAIK